MHSTNKTQLSDCNEIEHTDKKNHRYFSLIKSTKPNNYKWNFDKNLYTIY